MRLCIFAQVQFCAQAKPLYRERIGSSVCQEDGYHYRDVSLDAERVSEILRNGAGTSRTVLICSLRNASLQFVLRAHGGPSMILAISARPDLKRARQLLRHSAPSMHTCSHRMGRSCLATT